ELEDTRRRDAEQAAELERTGREQRKRAERLTDDLSACRQELVKLKKQVSSFGSILFTTAQEILSQEELIDRERRVVGALRTFKDDLDAGRLDLPDTDNRQLEQQQQVLRGGGRDQRQQRVQVHLSSLRRNLSAARGEPPDSAAVAAADSNGAGLKEQLQRELNQAAEQVAMQYQRSHSSRVGGAWRLQLAESAGRESHLADRILRPMVPGLPAAAPAWQLLARRAGEVDGLSVGHVDIAKEEVLAGMFLITQLPTIYLYTPDGSFDPSSIPAGASDDQLAAVWLRFARPGGGHSGVAPLPWYRSPTAPHVRCMAWLIRGALSVRDLHTRLTGPQIGMSTHVAYLVILCAAVAVGVGLVLCLVCLCDRCCPEDPPAEDDEQQLLQQQKVLEAAATAQRQKLREAEASSSQGDAAAAAAVRRRPVPGGAADGEN
uniref:Thioredoxin domain-containing protein n=1 Tax=Macrostomum lignano TaxID=282301 RepID=A0A1I8HZ66_9PLAT